MKWSPIYKIAPVHGKLALVHDSITNQSMLYKDLSRTSWSCCNIQGSDYSRFHNLRSGVPYIFCRGGKVVGIRLSRETMVSALFGSQSCLVLSLVWNSVWSGSATQSWRDNLCRSCCRCCSCPRTFNVLQILGTSGPCMRASSKPLENQKRTLHP